MRLAWWNRPKRHPDCLCGMTYADQFDRKVAWWRDGFDFGLRVTNYDSGIPQWKRAMRAWATHQPPGDNPQAP